ncbi:MAG: type II toxin-antitoxin system Phd/YefM family antitoxin [Candidatus Omnitrophica bacterium]|nr:type II toxin-antitoxin system Phd/YefM family antitoxin [Candidatus Omnitrophota bacterium]
MVQFVNIREFKTKTDSILRRLDRSDVILTVRGKPKAVLHRVSENDLAWREEKFTSEELDKLEKLAKEPGKVYKTGASFLKALKQL